MLKQKRRWIKAVTGGLVLCLLTSLCGLYGRCEGVRSSVVRLHILANSDSLSDQEHKLAVRDALQVQVDEVFGGCENLEQAITAAEELPEHGSIIRNIVLFAVLVYELVGPLLTKIALTRAGDIVPKADKKAAAAASAAK